MLGKIGHETARLLVPWGASLQYSARRDADLAGLPPMPRVDLDTLLRTSDIVLVLASLNPETRGLIDAEKFKLMKPTAILINTRTRRHRRRGGACLGA
jgi:phosphoglycerate dehydrogenase-like enzyme